MFPILAVSATAGGGILAAIVAAIYAAWSAFKKFKPAAVPAVFREPVTGSPAAAIDHGPHVENVAALDAVRLLQLGLADMGKPEVQFHAAVINSVFLDCYDPVAAVNDCLYYVLQRANAIGNTDLAKHVSQAIAVNVPPVK